MMHNGKHDGSMSMVRHTIVLPKVKDETNEFWVFNSISISYWDAVVLDKIAIEKHW